MKTASIRSEPVPLFNSRLQFENLIAYLSLDHAKLVEVDNFLKGHPHFAYFAISDISTRLPKETALYIRKTRGSIKKEFNC
jgi:hypothetical protein